MVTYNQLYALPKDRWEWNRDKSDGGNGFERFKIEASEADAKAAEGLKIACRIGDEDFMVVDVDAHGTDEGLNTLEKWRVEHPAFDKTYYEKSKSGGYHFYFNKVDAPILKTAFPSIDLMNQHDLWVIVAPTEGYTVENNADTLQDLPEALRVTRSVDAEGDRGLDMPALIQPRGVGARTLRQNPDLEAMDWNSVGGRNQALFDACVRMFHRASGSPEERMGKALYVIDEWLGEIEGNADKHFHTIEAWWDFNRGLSAILDKAKEEEANGGGDDNNSDDDSNGGGGGGNGGGGAADIISFVLDNYTLGVTGANKTFVVPKNGLKRPIQLPVSGGKFKNKLAADLYRQRNIIANRTTMENAIAVIVGMAAEQEPTEFDLRVARREGMLVIDMDEPTSTRCIVVTADGWSVEDEPPAGILFTNANGAYPLPEPKRGADLDLLRQVLNLPVDSPNWPLIEGWVVASVFPDVPRPLLGLFGSPGSAKTTRGTFCVSIIDPRAELGGAIGKGKDASTTALNNFFVGYDNEKEKVSEETSDFISRLVTGSAIAQRALYTDAELFYESYKRSGVLSAVSVPYFKSDTLERIIQVHLEPIEESQRTTLTAVREAFEQNHARILGAVCDALVKVLRDLPTLPPVSEKPRMSDYYEIVRAYSDKCANAFFKASKNAMYDAAEDNQFVGVVREWLDNKSRDFRITPAQAFSECLYIANGHAETSWFPKSSNTFSAQIMLNMGPLQMFGWRVRKVRVQGSRLFHFSYDGGEALDLGDDTPDLGDATTPQGDATTPQGDATKSETVTLETPSETRICGSNEGLERSNAVFEPDVDVQGDDGDASRGTSILNESEEEKEEEEETVKATQTASPASPYATQNRDSDWATSESVVWF